MGDGASSYPARVAICTERVEAKLDNMFGDLGIHRCNLHGACGGKGFRRSARGYSSCVAICTVCVEAKYERNEPLDCRNCCNLHGACRETERHHPPTEKNPRKFMQTYCIFIHLGV